MGNKNGMAQFQVPQFIEIEDKIIGPLTLKQFLYLAGGGALLFILFFFLEFFLWFIVALVVVPFVLALSFLKINGRPFIYFLTAMIGFIFKPKLYLWKKKEE